MGVAAGCAGSGGSSLDWPRTVRGGVGGASGASGVGDVAGAGCGRAWAVGKRGGAGMGGGIGAGAIIGARPTGCGPQQLCPRAVPTAVQANIPRVQTMSGSASLRMAGILD
jgi:hypothetical protein